MPLRKLLKPFIYLTMTGHIKNNGDYSYDKFKLSTFIEVNIHYTQLKFEVTTFF